MNSNLLLAGVFAIVLIAGAVITGRARGHDIYGDWKMPDNPGLSCCNESDCRSVTAAQDMDGNWTTFVEGRKVPIPARKVMKIPSPDGRSHWCGTKETTYCFVAGEVRG